MFWIYWNTAWSLIISGIWVATIISHPDAEIARSARRTAADVNHRAFRGFVLMVAASSSPAKFAIRGPVCDSPPFPDLVLILHPSHAGRGAADRTRAVIPEDRHPAEGVAIHCDAADRRERQVGRHQDFAGRRHFLQQT